MLSVACKLKQDTPADLLEWLKAKAMATAGARKNGGTTETFVHCWWKGKMVQPPWKTTWQFLTKLNISTPYDPEIIRLQIFTEMSWKLCPHKNCTWIFIAALNLEATKMSFNRWIVWHTYIMEYNTAIKRNVISRLENPRRNLKC